MLSGIHFGMILNQKLILIVIWVFFSVGWGSDQPSPVEGRLLVQELAQDVLQHPIPSNPNHLVLCKT